MIARFFNCNIRLAFFISFLFLPACSLLGVGAAFVDPELRLVDIRIKEATVLQTVLEFDVEIDNENAKSIYIQGGSQRVYLNDQFIGKGLLTEAVELPAFGQSGSQIRLYVNNLTLLGKLLPILESEELKYRFDSTLSVGKGFTARRVRTSSEDTFRFTRPLDLSPLRPMS